MTAGAPHRRETVRRHLVHVAVRMSVYTVALFTLYVLAPLDAHRSGSIILELTAALVVLIVVVVWQVRAIIRSPFPRLQAVEAVVISIPLLIVSFATAYVEIAQNITASFTEPINRIDGVYFTVTVLTTVGFGDIAPRTDAARLVVTGQMIADLILVGLTAKVIFGAAQRRREALGADPTEPDVEHSATQSEIAGSSTSSRAGDAQAALPLQSDRGPRR